MEPEVVGFVGLGIMGSGRARNLLKNNTPLLVHNRSPDKAQQLKKEFPNLVTLAETQAEVVAKTKRVYVMLSTPDVVKLV